MQFEDYSEKVLSYEGNCPACAYANHEFSLLCGMAYEDELLTVSQDWELPINGVFIVSPKRHIVQFEELTITERTHLFEVVNKILIILRKNNIANHFNVLFEEKKDIHFHVWILPRDGWKEINIDPTKDIRQLLSYSKA